VWHAYLKEVIKNMTFLAKSRKLVISLLIVVLFLLSVVTSYNLSLFAIYILIIIASSNNTKDTFKIVFYLCLFSMSVAISLTLSRTLNLTSGDFLVPVTALLSVVAAYVILLSRHDNQSGVTQRHNDKLSNLQHTKTLQQLSGSVAHDFNNVMSVVMGNAELLKVSLCVPGSSKLFIDEILKGIQKGTNLTQSLLSFAQKQFLQPTEIDLNKLILNYLTHINLPHDNKNKIHFSATKDLWMAKIDATFFEECLLHLVQNALQANSNNISIEVSNIVDNTLQEPKHYVLMAVSDDGIGISDQNLRLIYQPFFTTRKAEGANGLGLSVVYGFCQQSGGRIEQQSSLEKGTTFKLTLPATTPKNLNNRAYNFKKEFK
jgi:signal transduction histidine kinase